MSQLDQSNSEELFKKYDASFYRIIDKLYDHDDKMKDFSELEEQVNVLEKVMIELFDSSQKDMFYWDFCPIDVYINHYNDRKAEFCEEYPGTSELDFVNFEIRSIEDKFFVLDRENNLIEKTTISKEEDLHIIIDEFFSPFNIRIHNHELAIRLFVAQKRKFKFLVDKRETMMNQDTTDYSEEETVLDLSNTSYAMRIVLMHELGILNYIEDLLRKEMIFSNNKMAEVISSFTGIHVKTVQPYINPIYSPTALQNKNPLRNPKNIEKSRQKLSDLGFSINKQP